MDENKNQNYEVKILEKAGTCDSELFEKMAKRGDLDSTSIAKLLEDHKGEPVNVVINGYAICEIKTKDKTFKLGYYATDIGLISTGSEIFAECVKDYLGSIEMFTIVEVKTRQGKTYKATPYLASNKNTNE